MLGVVHPTSYEYHNIHDEPQPQHHDAHSNEQVIYGQPHHETVSQHNELLTTENFPSDKHTQVFFKSSTEPSYQSDEQHYAPEEHHHHHQQQQYLAPAQVNTYRAPLVYHKYEEQYYNQHGDDQGDGAQYADSAGQFNRHVNFLGSIFPTELNPTNWLNLNLCVCVI